MKQKITIALMIILAMALFSASPVLAAKSYYAERFDVLINLQEDGSALITETVEFHFEGDPFTFAFREISANQTDGIVFLDASMNDIPMSEGTDAGQVEVTAGNPLKVTWHFPATSDAAHVFTVRYRADGVIRKGEADALIWRAIPEDHDYLIKNSTITLMYPSSATLLEPPTLDQGFDTTQEEGRIVLTASGIAEDQDLILTAKFTPNSLAQTAPQWQIQKEQADAATAKALPAGVMAGVAALLLGGLGLSMYIRSNARELNTGSVIVVANPPADVSPALVGKLTGQQHNFMGTIFDLAQRGVLEVNEEKGFWGATNHVLTRKEATISLRPHEQGLLDALFKPDETQINMNEIATRLSMKNKLFDEPLQEELVQRGWLDPQRNRKRTMLVAVGMTALFIPFVIFIGTMILAANSKGNLNMMILSAILAGISAAAMILSIAMLIYSAGFSILTLSGEEQAARWKGFAEYLKQVSKGREPAIRPDYFERYLAYAAVFGLGAKWAKYFQNLGGVSLPVWFHATAGSTADFGAMVAVMSASDTSGASAGAAAGGASGGGSSGAG